MHIEDYEWVLYMHGDLSKKRESEMEAHLENCSQCLAAYVRITTGESIEPAVKKSISSQKWKQTGKPRSLRWGVLAALVLLLFIGVSFTPSGQIAWANLRLTLEELGNTLGEVFGVGEKADVITTVDQSPQTHHGIEVKIDQIFIESDKVFYSVLIASDLITENKFNLQISNQHLDIEGENIPFVSNNFVLTPPNPTSAKDEDGKPVPVSTWIMQAVTAKDYSGNEAVNVQIRIDEMVYWEKDFGEPSIIKGPWVFDFVVDGTLVTRETREFPLKVQFKEKNDEFEIEQLSISPIRARINVTHLNARLLGSYVDEDGKEIKYYDTSINLTGFLIQDGKGNEAEIATRDYPYSESEESVFEFTSDVADNPYSWLKNADQVTITPYFTRLSGNSGGTGIRRNYPVDGGGFTIQLTKGGQDD